MARTATKTKRKMVRVATYIRMSTDKQDTSPQRQQREINAWLKSRKNYKVVATFEDLGVSGDDTEKRHQFKAMMQAAVAGDFDRIIAFDMSRIGRFDSLEAGRWFAPLRDADVVIETTTDGEVDWHSLSGRIVSAVEAEAKNDLVRRNSQATVTGQTRKAVDGHGYPGGPTPFGYKRVFKEINGKPVGVLVLEPDNAAVVKRIFEMYSRPRGTMRSVSRQLNAEGIPSAKGGKWQKNSVQRILDNPIYIGTYQWGKRQTGRYYVRDGDAGLQERRKSDPITFTKPIQHENKMPRIISDDLWQKVLRIRKERRKETMGPAVKKPLSGLVFCQNCGSVMRADGEYFRCKNSDPDYGEVQCPSYRMPADDILAGAMAAIKQELSTPTKRRQLQTELEAAVGRRKGDDQQARELSKRLKQIELEIKRGTSRLAAVPDNLVDDLTTHLEGLAAQRDKVRVDLEELENRSTGRTGAKTLVRNVITGMDALLKACSRGAGDPVVVNGLLKAAGIRLNVTPLPANKRIKGNCKAFLEVFVPLVLIVAMLGPPGSGKTMLAKRISTILPPLRTEESIETSQIYSALGLLPSGQPLLVTRPFRAPHHTISEAGLIGGRSIPMPGEISLAHNGILFLDELPEYNRRTLEVLRQPLEDGTVTISRARSTTCFPSAFMLIAAMNPCPCGYRGDSNRDCQCTVPQVERYMSKISGPLLDRIDIHLEVSAVPFGELSARQAGTSSTAMRQQVHVAREIQHNRFKKKSSTGNMYNARMTSREIRHYCQIDSSSIELLRSAVSNLGLSARAHDKVLRVARTIADLDATETIECHHLSEAIQYRLLDRKLWT